MNILLTNDDSIFSEGIYALYTALKKVGNVTVVAPDAEQSAVGHAITMSDPLRVKKVNRRMKPFGYAVSGTPADCVKIAMISILKKKPDIVVSGINLGPNAGFSVLYSGTVSGATEGAMLGIPSIAVSLSAYKKPSFKLAADFTAKTAKRALKKTMPKGTFLNINVPNCDRNKCKGVKITTQAKTPIFETFDKRKDPRERIYYWLTGDVVNLPAPIGTDVDGIKKGFISVTPLQYDLTDHAFIDRMNEWKLAI